MAEDQTEPLRTGESKGDEEHGGEAFEQDKRRDRRGLDAVALRQLRSARKLVTETYFLSNAPAGEIIAARLIADRLTEASQAIRELVALEAADKAAVSVRDLLARAITKREVTDDERT